MFIANHPIGVCSWSIQPRDIADLVDKVHQLGLEHVQLALYDLLALAPADRDKELASLRDSGLKITAGMIAYPGEDYATIARIHETGGLVPDAQWPLRKKLTIDAGRLIMALGVPTLSTHVGFVPPPEAHGYETIIGRVREIAAELADIGVDLLLETGQEPSGKLLDFLDDLKASNIHINYDPANMMLYGADDPIRPIAAVARHIRHVHVKDAAPSAKPGMDWGTEVPFGAGAVGAARFLAALKAAGYAGPLVIEREAGTQRMADVRTAIHALERASR